MKGMPLRLTKWFAIKPLRFISQRYGSRIERKHVSDTVTANNILLQMSSDMTARTPSANLDCVSHFPIYHSKKDGDMSILPWSFGKSRIKTSVNKFYPPTIFGLQMIAVKSTCFCCGQLQNRIYRMYQKKVYSCKCPPNSNFRHVCENFMYVSIV